MTGWPEVSEVDEPPLCACDRHYIGAPCPVDAEWRAVTGATAGVGYMPTWKARDGAPTPIDQLEPRHLRNVLRFLWRNALGLMLAEAAAYDDANGDKDWWSPLDAFEAGARDPAEWWREHPVVIVGHRVLGLPDDWTPEEAT